MKKLSLKNPVNRPQSIRAAELLALGYSSYLFVAFVQLQLYPALVIPSLMCLVVYLATRSGNIVCYWLSVAILMGPLAKIGSGANAIDWGADWSTLFYQLFPPLICGLAGGILIIPENREWIKKHRQELASK